MTPPTYRPAPLLAPRRETTREVLLRATQQSPGVARIWWTAAIGMGVGPVLISEMQRIAALPTWADVWKPPILLSATLIFVAACGVVMGIMGPTFGDVKRQRRPSRLPK